MSFIQRLHSFFSRRARPSADLGSPAQVVISDAHIGTSMWQAAVLKSVGVEARIETLSDHAHYAQGLPVGSSPLFKELAQMPAEVVRQEFARRPDLSQLRWALCSFPPSRVEALKKLPEHVRILVNVGHRLHIHVPADRCVGVASDFKRLASNPRYVLATMSEYDYHYVRYHTGCELLRLPVVAMHVPDAIRNAPYRPANRVVLLGPSHNTSVILGFEDDLDSLNAQSEAYARERGLEPYAFDFIKALYPGDQATLENLRRHPAVLMNPYSAFSISMVELYQCNVPFFVPADPLLVDKMGDVRLHPLYQPADAVAVLNEAHPASETPYPYSPHDESAEAQRYWIQYMYFNQVRHAQRWATPQELFDLLYQQDLAGVSQAMCEENRSLFQAQREAWQALMVNESFEAKQP